jgi:hypothetical protein
LIVAGTLPSAQQRTIAHSLEDLNTLAIAVHYRDVKPTDLATRINKLPKWGRDYIHNIRTFVGAEEVQELTFLRDQNKALIKLVGELKAENQRLRKKITAWAKC